MRNLFEAGDALIDRLNANPDLLVSRLRPKIELDADYDKLLASN
jgi:hypothetical protein